MVDIAGAVEGLEQDLDREKLSIPPCRPFYFGHGDDTVSLIQTKGRRKCQRAGDPHATAGE